MEIAIIVYMPNTQQKNPEDKTKLPKRKIDEVAVASHQLSNPLAVIKGYIEALLDGHPGPLTEQQEEYLSDAYENVKAMIQTTNNILDVSRVEEKRLELRRKPFNLVEIVKKSIKEIHPLLEATNSQLEFDPPKEFLEEVISDSVKIKQVIDILISNAIKYHKGRGIIKIGISKADGHIKLSVSDNGVGISKKDQPKIFTKFFRGDKILELSPQGTGLGLFVAKAIIEDSGGKIGFKSKEGQGATFWFTLPIKK